MIAPGWSAAHARLAWARQRLAGERSHAVVDRLVRAGDVVVDAGASRGVFTARLAQLAGPRGAVHAFEPNPGELPWLEAVAASEPTVTVHPRALSDRDGPATLRVPLGADGRPEPPLATLGPAGAGAAAIAVEGTTLDAALAGRDPVAFVKIDVEGHELAVLRGAARLLERDRPRLLVEIERRHAGAAVEATFALLRGLGYRGEAIGPDGPFPLEDFDLERDQLAHLDPGSGAQGPAYVNDFVFAPASS